MESRHPHLLGFFLIPSYGDHTPNIRPGFISVSSQGTDLQEGGWGNFDETLSFLKQPNLIVVGSSKGFLLCVTNRDVNMTYIICNPVTREFCILPEPHKSQYYVAIAFICKGDEISLNGRNHYEIVRVGVSDPFNFVTLELETFSSTSGEWTQSILNTVSPVSLVTANLPAFVMEDVIYWKARSRSLVAYDRTRDDLAEVIELPGKNRRPVCWSDTVSVSEGKIHYCISDRLNIEVWALEDIQGRREWNMKYRVSFRKMFQMNPKIACPSTGLVGLKYLHPQRSNLLFLFLYQVPYWYDFKKKKLRRISNSTGSLSCSLPYEWPSVT